MKGNILIIDDNTLDLKIASAALERAGYACYGFTDHVQGTEWLTKNRPNVIFLDLQMPGVSGFDLITQYRKLENAAEVPIVIISGLSQIDDVKKAIGLGANDYIVKPLDPLVMQEKVRKMGASADEFNDVALPPEISGQAFFARSLKILSVSEFGIKVQSDFKVKPGETVELAGLSEEVIGSTRAIVRCLSSDQQKDGSGFIMQFTFVGMLEAQRQVIRNACRKIWIQAKGAA